MPYKDPAAMREYQRRWVQQRRERFTEGAACVDCGSTRDLELDHRDPREKVSHRIWSWSLARIAQEVEKCQWRCRACHIERHRAEAPGHGVGGWLRGCRCSVCETAKRRSDRRRGRESNARERLCRPSPNHSATSPDKSNTIQLRLFDAA